MPMANHRNCDAHPAVLSHALLPSTLQRIQPNLALTLVSSSALLPRVYKQVVCHDVRCELLPFYVYSATEYARQTTSLCKKQQCWAANRMAHIARFCATRFPLTNLCPLKAHLHGLGQVVGDDVVPLGTVVLLARGLEAHDGGRRAGDLDALQVGARRVPGHSEQSLGCCTLSLY